MLEEAAFGQPLFFTVQSGKMRSEVQSFTLSFESLSSNSRTASAIIRRPSTDSGSIDSIIVSAALDVFSKSAGQVIPISNGFAFAGTTGTDFGNVGRNPLRGPSQFNTDLSLGKRFEVSESRSIEFRAEFFNLFNTVNFANPISNLAAVGTSGGEIDETTGQIVPGSAGDFGKIISTSNNPRIMQLAVKFNF